MTPEEIIAHINDVMKKRDYNFRNREDFVQSRFDWEDLAETADEFYYLLLSIKDSLEEKSNQIK